MTLEFILLARLGCGLHTCLAIPLSVSLGGLAPPDADVCEAHCPALGWAGIYLVVLDRRSLFGSRLSNYVRHISTIFVISDDARGRNARAPSSVPRVDFPNVLPPPRTTSSPVTSVLTPLLESTSPQPAPRRRGP